MGLPSKRGAIFWNANFKLLLFINLHCNVLSSEQYCIYTYTCTEVAPMGSGAASRNQQGAEYPPPRSWDYAQHGPCGLQARPRRRRPGAPKRKSDLRNHQAIVLQPRLYDCLMVTQITLKTEGPHGLPSGRRTEVDPLYPGLIILAVYDCGHAFQSLERSEPVRERIDSRGRRVAALH